MNNAPLLPALSSRRRLTILNFIDRSRDKRRSWDFRFASATAIRNSFSKSASTAKRKLEKIGEIIRDKRG